MGNSRNSWATTVVIVAAIAGIVSLVAVSDAQAEKLLPYLIGFIGPTVAAIIAANKSQEAVETTKASAATLTRIDGRLNGELDSRIAEAVKSALREYHAATTGDCASGSCK